MASAVEVLSAALGKLQCALDDVVDAGNAVDEVSRRLAETVFSAGRPVDDVRRAVKKALSALEGAGA